MRKIQEVKIDSIQYKDDEKARQNFIHFVLTYLIHHNPVEKDDMNAGN